MSYPRNFDTELSKNLSWLLRHGAVKEGLPIASNGFIPLDAVLSHRSLSNRYTAEEIMRIVEADSKNRYTVMTCPSTKKLLIKANQGHSIAEVSELNLTKIRHASECPIVVHGTFYKNLPAIKRLGLKRMNRNHIHFSASDKLKPGTVRVSGIRHNCEVLIYLNTELALSKNIPLYRSENNVILSPGLNGSISTEFFDKVVDRKTGEVIPF
ncbi:tRNA 2'-phosphotransferase 1 [Episyrphus balteatus]|uniref:tRNA 2'-phosphotransferase 1 n=1 Tax=Episyrphus balteatus TaxID=286459 RepID=UPI002485AABA|nr:tRNA 2'-phosphotransferase 1 [Episyrphus balteatus]